MRNAKSGMRNKKQKLFAKLFNFKKKEYEEHSTREGYEKFVINLFLCLTEIFRKIKIWKESSIDLQKQPQSQIFV